MIKRIKRRLQLRDGRKAVSKIERKLRAYFDKQDNVSSFSFGYCQIKNQTNISVCSSGNLCELRLHAKLYELVGSTMDRQKAKHLEVKLKMAA